MFRKYGRGTIVTNPLETLSGGNFEPTPSENAKRILAQIVLEREMKQ